MSRLPNLKLLHGFIASLLVLVFVFLAPQEAQAQNVGQSSSIEPVGSNRLEDFKQAVGSNELSRDRLVFEDFANLEVLMIYGLAGCEAEDCPPELKVGMINTVGSMIAGMYDMRPVSGVAYAANILDRFRPTPAYAQSPGSGFQNLLPLLPIWRAFRDFTYILFALAFVAMGFAIMFRVKLNPQVTITIQSALPRLIVGLLLITFSYAIAGFVVDLIYVFIAIGILIFSQVPNAPELGRLQDQFLTGGFGSAVGSIFGAAGGALKPGAGALGALGGIIYGAISTFGGRAAVAGAAGAPLSLTGVLGAIGIGFAIGAALFILIFLLIIAYLVVRLFIELLRSYIAIILAVIFAPFQIILGVVPGLPGFTGWLKGLFANALVFPAVALALVLARVLLEQPGLGELWAAPVLGGQGNLIRLLIGFGILLIVYQIPPAIRQAMGAEGPRFAPLEAVGFGTRPFVGFAAGRARALSGRAYANFILRAYDRTPENGRYFGLTKSQLKTHLRGLHQGGFITDQEAVDRGILREELARYVT